MKHKFVGGSGDGAQALCLSHRQVYDAWNQSSAEVFDEKRAARRKRALSALFRDTASSSITALLL